MTIVAPKINLDIRGAQVTTIVPAQKLLFVGQKTAAGTAVSGQLYTHLEEGITHETLFGKDSIATAMVRVAQRVFVNSKIKPQLDVIAFSDAGAATPAVSTIAVTGTTAAEAGTIIINIGSFENHRFEIPVIVGETPAQFITAAVAAINLDEYVPVTASDSTGILLTAVNAGTVGNHMSLSIEGSISGLNFTAPSFASGATDPTDSSVLTTIENLRYQTTVMPKQYSVADYVTFLEGRFNETDPIIKDGVLIICNTDTFVNFASDSLGLNKKCLVYFPNKLISETLYKGSLHQELDYVVAAHIAALRALRLTEGANISDIVDTSLESDDSVGGIGIATLPYHNTPLEYIPVCDNSKSWTKTELDSLTGYGFALFGNNSSNDTVILGTVVTRYKTNSVGAADVSFKYLNYVDQAVSVREYFTDSFKLRFNQTRLTTGIVVPRKNMVNVGIIRAEAIRIYGELVDLGLMVGGETARQQFMDGLTVTIDLALGKATVTMINPPVTQLREIDGVIQTVFSI
jgi:phage tail sheath gpL-like